MKPLRFDRLTKKIGLVLISSSLVLGGCSTRCEDQDGPAVPGQLRPDCRGGGGGHVGHGSGGRRTVIIPHGGGGSSSRAPAAGSARGGFGATGHATASGA